MNEQSAVPSHPDVFLPPPADQDTRREFIHGLRDNFSIVAPAGVGKTESIVSRIAALAKSCDALDRLPRLVVVTYTNKAAQEMRLRARRRLMEARVSPHVSSAFNRSFFGTLHGFCLRLLGKYGHHIGVPPRPELLTEADDLWHRFVQELDDLGPGTHEPTLHELLRLVPFQDVLALATKIPMPRPVPPPDIPRPEVDIHPLLAFLPEAKIESTIRRSQDEVRAWIEAMDRSDGLAPLPLPRSKAQAFSALWRQTFTPLRDWMRMAFAHVASEVALRYREYRLRAGKMTFDDQIALAAELIDHPQAAEALRGERYEILLDEAQDTDPMQFRVLTSCGGMAEGGRFVMVGDPQQSIYGERADLETYRGIQCRLASLGGQTRAFQVTFRCARKIVDFLNATFARVLDGQAGQVDYVPLIAAPNATEGQVVRLPIPFPPATRGGLGAEDIEAERVAEFLQEAGPEGLRARSWDQVAILCMRKGWFAALGKALRRAGLPFHVQSHGKALGDNPAYAWTTALVWIAVYPRDSYEIAGVLRDIFGISDQELAEWSGGDGSRFSIESAPDEASAREATGFLAPKVPAVAAALRLLAGARRAALSLPLRDAVRALAEEARLETRLASLPEPRADEILLERDALMASAAEAEARGLSLLEFARALRQGFLRDRPDTEAGAEAEGIQILTCHKAKGLEWDAVVVPYLFREVTTKKDAYPRLAPSPRHEAPVILLDDLDLAQESSIAAKAADELQLARLLYVSCTRARNTLVLVDDAAFPSRSSSNPKPRLGRSLVDGDPSRSEAWYSLPGSASPDPAWQPPSQDKPSAWWQMELSPPGSLATARREASRFIRRSTPHHMEESHHQEEPPDARQDFPADNFADGQAASQRRGKEYGVWWHSLMEALPWAGGPKGWQPRFEIHLARCPQPTRANDEWTRFARSAVARFLAQPGLLIHTEMPFLLPPGDGNEFAIEGVVDLAAFDSRSRSWTIVDWKTNLLGKAGLAELKEHYHPQLGAYLQVWRRLFALPVRGILYATTLGESTEIEDPGPSHSP